MVGALVSRPLINHELGEGVQMSAIITTTEAETLLVAYVIGDETGGRFNEFSAFRSEYFQMSTARAVWAACASLVKVGSDLDALKIANASGLSLSELFSTFVGNHAGEWNSVASRTILGKWALRQYSSIAELASSDTSDFQTIRARLHHIDEALSGLGGDPLLAKLADARVALDVTPPPERVIYCLKQITIATPGNLVAICAPPKAGKTALVAAFMAAAISNSTTADCLGVQGYNEAGRALVHLETEQSKYDSWRVLETAARRAGVETIPPWLESYRLADWSTKERRDALPHVLRLASAKHGGIHAVLLDGLADFVVDPNDAEACFAFLHELRCLAGRFDCAIICILHLNPGSEKSRGHLGSELERKAQSNLTLERDANGRTVVYSKYQRGVPIPKDQGPCFVWNDDANMHTTTDTVGIVKARVERETLTNLARECFANSPTLTTNTLISLVMAKKTIELRQAEKLTAAMVSQGILRRPKRGEYSLAA